jgi:hypothetical protein
MGLSWVTYAPDGCEVQVRWQAGRWSARTSDGGEAVSTNLTSALSEVLRLQPGIRTAHGGSGNAAWAASLAQQLERELRREQER